MDGGNRLREVVPGLRWLAIMSNADNPGTVLEMGDVLTTTRTLGLDVVTLKIRRAEDIAPAFEALKGRADALYVCNDPLVNTNRVRINTSALGARLPTVYNWRENVEAGGLMSYGTNLLDTFRRSADLIDKVLRGAKPADIPVEQPTKFDLTINLTTAKALGARPPPDAARSRRRGDRVAVTQQRCSWGKTGRHMLVESLRAVFGSIHRTCLSPLVTDRVMEAWYHPSIA
jgi:ABC-type uncharacterized transport system substrate-binding protein